MKKSNHFVLDTNMLVSAFLLASTSIAAQAYYKAKADGEIVLSEDAYNEFSDVFIRPKFDRYLPLTKRLIIIEDLKTIVKFIPVQSWLAATQRMTNILNWQLSQAPTALLPVTKIYWF
jgi:predicted nucleic acid-binding protein